MSAGQSFGERSLLSPVHEKRSATVSAGRTSPCTVLVLTRSAFIDLVCLHFEDMDVLLSQLKIATTRDYVMDEHVRMTLARLCQRVGTLKLFVHLVTSICAPHESPVRF